MKDFVNELMFDVSERMPLDWGESTGSAAANSSHQSSNLNQQGTRSSAQSRSIQISPSSSEQSHYITRAQLDEALGKPSEPYISKLIAEGRLTQYRLIGRRGQWFDLRQVGTIVRRRRAWAERAEGRLSADSKADLLRLFVGMVDTRHTLHYRQGVLSVLSQRYAMALDELRGKERAEYVRGQRDGKRLISGDIK